MLKHMIAAYFICLLIICITDFCWLYFSGQIFYKKHLGQIMRKDFFILPAIFFYPLYVLGIVTFVLYPTTTINASFVSVLLKGCLLGLCSYGAYDLTNHATIKDWPLIVTLVDIAWGVFVTSFSSLLTYVLINRIF